MSLCGVLLLSCDDGSNFAPVTEISTIEPIPKTGIHRVTQNETLYEIAWRYGLDYRYLAQRNLIREPYSIYPGQVIYLRGEDSATWIKPQNRPSPVLMPAVTASANKPSLEMEPNDASSTWLWPAKGKIAGNFSAANKGINIVGQAGEPIYAAATGKVVYSGNGLRGYGNLIILKHNSLYLSAYAHNSNVLVKEGDWVKQGQKIAEMGDTGADKVMLHFEIRRAGKPINPLSLYH